MQAIATKQKILDAAEKLIGERGYDDVSVDDIVDACAVAKGTFYHYFKTKDELIVYINHTPYEELECEAASVQDCPLAERLTHLITSWFTMLDKYNLHFARQAIRHYANPASLGEPGGTITQMDLGMNIIRSCFENGVKRGELLPGTPIETLTREIMFSMQGSTLYQCKYADTFDVMEWASTFTDLVLGCLLEPYMK
jgi:AcrR family transcriptional regulator